MELSPSDAPVMPSDAQRAHARARHLVCLHAGLAGKPFIGRKVFGEEGDERFEGETVDMRGVQVSPHFATADYTSANRYHSGRRLTDHSISVGHIVADWDFYRDGLPYSDRDAGEVMDILSAAMIEAGVPLPSYWLFSGRGLQAVWVTTGAKGFALARVRAVYEALHGPALATNGMPVPTKRRSDARIDAHERRMLPLWRANRACGLDGTCKDAARIIRLAGSIHAKSGRVAALLAPATFEDVERISFHDLADAVLPYTRAEIQALREARAAGADIDEAVEAKPRKVSTGPRRARTGYGGFRSEILADLYRMRDAGLIQKGRRELWVFHVANALCHIRGGNIEDWADEIGPHVGLSRREVLTALSSLAKRQERHERGETQTYGEREWSPLYHYGAAKMIREFKLTQEEAERAGLRMLRPSGTIAKTPAERKRAERDRKNPNRKTREDAKVRRTMMGVDALIGRAEGDTMVEMAAEYGLSVETVRKTMNALAASIGLPDISVASCKHYVDNLFWAPGGTDVSLKVDPVEADATEETSCENTNVTSHLIVDQGPVLSVPPSPEPAVAPGEVRVRRWTRLFATIETASAVWDWHWVLDTMFLPHTWETRAFQTSPGVSLPADRVLAEAALRDLEASVAAPVKRSRAPGRAVSDRRPRGSQRLRRTGYHSLPALDVDHRADLYRLASGG